MTGVSVRVIPCLDVKGGRVVKGVNFLELRDATQAWLDANSDAPDALRRIVAENRDPITRALAAQERDARA